MSSCLSHIQQCLATIPGGFRAPYSSGIKLRARQAPPTILIDCLPAPFQHHRSNLIIHASRLGSLCPLSSLGTLLDSVAGAYMALKRLSQTSGRGRGGQCWEGSWKVAPHPFHSPLLASSCCSQRHWCRLWEAPSLPAETQNPQGFSRPQLQTSNISEHSGSLEGSLSIHRVSEHLGTLAGS